MDHPTKMDRDKFFAMLDQLTTSQIEARLPLWDTEQLKLVEEYLERKGSSAAQKELGAARPVTREELSAVALATRANKMATFALIIAIGAMFAAIAAGLVAFEALQH